MRARIAPIITTTLILAALWLLLADEIAPGQVLLALLLGLGIAVVLSPRAITTRAEHSGVGHRVPRRLLALVKWLLRLLVDILIANFRIAALVLNPRRHPSPIFVEMPLSLENPTAIYLLASAISLTPGTLSADISPDRRVLLIHALDRSEVGADTARYLATLKAHYEAPLLEVFQ